MEGKVSKIWLKMVQLRAKNLKGVRSRGPKQDFNEIMETDYYANFGIEVRSNEALEQTKSPPKLNIISISQLKTPIKGIILFLVTTLPSAKIGFSSCFLTVIESFFCDRLKSHLYSLH